MVHPEVSPKYGYDEFHIFPHTTMLLKLTNTIFLSPGKRGYTMPHKLGIHFNISLNDRSVIYSTFVQYGTHLGTVCE